MRFFPWKQGLKRGVTLLAIASALTATGAMTSGCYAEEDEEMPPPEYAEGYAPVYYDGYMVFYDDYGRPFYYGDEGAVIWVAPTSPLYLGLVNHYRFYGPAYRGWYAHYGYRYHGYRFHGHVGGYHGGPHGGGGGHHR